MTTTDMAIANVAQGHSVQLGSVNGYNPSVASATMGVMAFPPARNVYLGSTIALGASVSLDFGISPFSSVSMG
jgi:hypothetical protein